VWLSLRVARWVTECVVATVQRGADEPVREIVQEVLAEHRTDDRPIVQAFQEAVDAGGKQKRPLRLHDRKNPCADGCYIRYSLRESAREVPRLVKIGIDTTAKRVIHVP